MNYFQHWHKVYFIILAIFSLHPVYTKFLNIEELNSIHYNIDITNNPVLKTQQWHSDIVTITNKYGQEYVCSLPEIQISDIENKKEEDLLDHVVDISELLKPMEAAPCLVKKKDWWSYEFCYGSVIKQYHLEDNKVAGTILILGKYESEYNWRNNSKIKNKLQKYHSQSYVNGTRCDITGEHRRTEVRFHCEEGVGDYIQQVDEPESCRYVIIIATTRVCHHPYLKPSFNKMSHNINCAPALSQDEFQRYQQIQEAKQLEEEEFSRKETSSGAGLDPHNNLNVLGENETDDEDSKVSIRLVSIPISKRAKSSKEATISKEPSILSEENRDELVANSNFDETASSLRNVFDYEDPPTGDVQGFGGAQPYLSEAHIMENDIEQLIRDFNQRNEEQAKDDEIADTEKDAKQFGDYREHMEKLMVKWMKLQNEYHVQGLLDRIKSNLDENAQQLQETANKITEKSLSSYLTDLAEIADKYKKKLPSPNEEDLSSEEEKKLLDALNSLTDILSEAEIEMLDVIHKKKKLDHLEKFLESHLKKTESMLKTGLDPTSPTAGVGDSEEGDIPVDKEGPAESADSLTLKTKRFEDLIDVVRDDSEDIGNMEEIEEADTETRQVKILKEKSLDEERTTKLEQRIKERLQKSGLDNIGQKIEVKILTPTYLEDDEKESLSSLSQEETEAFHNMIVNILSASAEELKEKERHLSLESNYNFRLEDIAENSGVGEVPEFTSGNGEIVSEVSSDSSGDNSADSSSDNSEDSKYSDPDENIVDPVPENNNDIINNNNNDIINDKNNDIINDKRNDINDYLDND